MAGVVNGPGHRLTGFGSGMVRPGEFWVIWWTVPNLCMNTKGNCLKATQSYHQGTTLDGVENQSS